MQSAGRFTFVPSLISCKAKSGWHRHPTLTHTNKF